jgi:hypothetical protein
MREALLVEEMAVLLDRVQGRSQEAEEGQAVCVRRADTRGEPQGSTLLH